MRPDFALLRIPIALSMLGATLLFLPTPDAQTTPAPRLESAGIAARERILPLSAPLSLALREGQHLELPFEGASPKSLISVNRIEVQPGQAPGSQTVFEFHSSDLTHKLILRGREIGPANGPCPATRFEILSGEQLELVGLGPQFATTPVEPDRLQGLVIGLSDCLALSYGELGQTELALLQSH